MHLNKIKQFKNGWLRLDWNIPYNVLDSILKLYIIHLIIIMRLIIEMHQS